MVLAVLIIGITQLKNANSTKAKVQRKAITDLSDGVQVLFP
jgi:hypothetical protein